MRGNVGRYVRASLSPSTQSAYASDLRRFIAWGGSVPADPSLVARYIAAHARTLKVSTLSRYLASISRAHTAKGLKSPVSTPLVRSTLRGIRRIHGSAQRQARPLSPAMVRKLAGPVPSWDKLRNIRDRALLLMGFAGGFRRSELVRLLTTDLSFTSKGVMVRLRVSKTDQYHKGRDVALPHGTAAATCPVRALRAWLIASAVETEAPCPLFRRIDRHGHIADSALSGAAIGWILRERLRMHKVDEKGYSAHSLRAGFVTSAAKAGQPTWAIQRQTGHKSEQMVSRYIRGLDPFERNAAATLWGKL